MEGMVVFVIVSSLTGILADLSKHQISARSAKTFLLHPESRKHCPEAQFNTYCEDHYAECSVYHEPVRESKCSHVTCPSGQFCVFANTCLFHDLPVTCIPHACAFNTCQNGGTCELSSVNSYCSCVPGFHGDDCSITPCATYVCHNGGSCKLQGHQAACDCTPGYETGVCKMDCRPGPVDVVFVIDGSFSQSNLLNMSTEFVRKFIDKVPIGKNDFQFAVITYSTDATVIFDFNDYTTKPEIESALMGIRFQESATFTEKGLSKASQILSDSSSGVRMTVAPKYVILLTDGLSTDRLEAINEAEIMHFKGYRIMTIGVGAEVDHSEILQLATNSSYVYSPEGDDAFNRLMLEASDEDCKNCSESSTTDLLILLDTSSANQTQSQYHMNVDVLKALVNQLKMKDTHIRVGLATFDEDIDPVFDLSDALNTDNMLSKIVTIRRSKEVTKSNVTIGLRFAQHEGFKAENGGRIDSRKIVVLFSNGHWIENDLIKTEIRNLAGNNIKVFIVGTGLDANIENLLEVVTSAFNVIYVEDTDNEDNVKNIVSDTIYVKCEERLFG